jgi:heme A synthase
MMAFLRNTALLALVIALATVFAGWWTVPFAAAVWTLTAPRRGGVIGAAIAGGLAWAALLALASRNGPIGDLAAVLGQIMSVSAAALITLTVAYAALLSGSAALVAQAVRPPPPAPHL